jgi:hypothetical protein
MIVRVSDALIKSASADCTTFVSRPSFAVRTRVSVHCVKPSGRVVSLSAKKLQEVWVAFLVEIAQGDEQEVDELFFEAKFRL